ncbi:MAG: glycogen synthase [Dissulfurimicrobium sp.]
MTIWMITREYRGVAGVGGVKDVVCELAEALARAGHEITVIIPCYGFIELDKMGFKTYGHELEIDMDYVNEERREKVSFFRGEINGVSIVLVGSERFREKLGVYTYTEEDERLYPSRKKGEGHYDYFAMNVLHQKASLALAVSLGLRPDVFHCHDGHTALIPALIREIEGFRHYFLYGVTALVTIHNAGLGYHQEVADLPFAKVNTALPWRVIYSSLLNGKFDPLLAGAAYGVINTVSENYARELRETELDAMTGWLGHALLDRGIRLFGITNGINVDDFDPTHPERLGLPVKFDPATGDIAGKIQCKRLLCELIQKNAIEGLTLHGDLVYRPDQPLITAISRFTEQKGIDVLAGALAALLEEDREFQVAILGDGKKEIELQLVEIAERDLFKGRMVVLTGYNQKFANLLYAAGDFFVIPSRYEPCGLTDFMAQLMGNLPIVRATGGLVKVVDGLNGFSYVEHSPNALQDAIKRAFDVFRNSSETRKRMIMDAVSNIRRNYTWDSVKDVYLRLYSGQTGLT